MSDPNGAAFYIPGALLLLAGFLKLPPLWRNPKDELLRSVCVLLFAAAGVFATAAVPSIAAINRFTGVPNAAAPVVYTILTGFSGANLVLIIRWSSGPEDAERAARWSRRCNWATLAVIAAINGLFVLGDAPQERLVDLDTYYANTPYIREMIVLYLVAHTTAAVTMTVLCTRWARVVHGPLRAGLVFIVIGYILNLVYDGLKFTALGARWTDHDLDRLSWPIAPPIAAVSALLIGIGFVLPLLSQRLMDYAGMWRRYHQLQPAWRELRAATRHSINLAGGISTPIEVRVTQIESDIYDGILSVHPFLSPEVRELSLAEALKTAPSDEEAAVIADAAVLAHAVVMWSRHAAGQSEAPAEHAGDGPLLASANSAVGLVRLSRALSRSAIVRATREAAVLESSAR
ncbi:MAB_1171c family putative transporter [Streptomyces sp. NPDC059447]|uniref:MAB_1171c family putative transporter n=1 Tax=Streptomyces sp. NPDC059447 TaxID=3346834 RepID=UPI00368CF78E